MANTKFLDYNGLSKLVEKIKNTYVTMMGGNEFNFIGKSGWNESPSIVFNYRKPDGTSTTTAITNYTFYNGQGKATGVSVSAENFNGNINGHTVEKNVPSSAKFTDTTYTLSGDGTNKVTITDSNKSPQSITINNVQRATVATYANQYSYNGIDRDFVYDAVDGSNHYIKCKDTTILRANGTNINKYAFIINSDTKGGCYIYDSEAQKGTTWGPNGIIFDKAGTGTLVAADGTFATAITDAEIQTEIDKAITL